MGYATLLRNTDERQKINRKILDQYGSWEKWWESLNWEFGSRLMGVFAGMSERTLIHKLERRLCESPIEEMFWDAAAKALPGIEPAYSVGPYRLDFAIPDRKVGIELDGHEYHSTVDQRTSDAQRQRWLERQGWRLLRFTGAEVFASPGGCVVEVEAFLASMEAPGDGR